MAADNPIADESEDKSDPIKDFFATLSKRPFHREITAELIAELPDSDLEVAIFDIVWAARGVERSDLLQTLPRGYRVVYTTMALEAEVSNGGFNQFFYNSSRELYDPAIQAYTELGLAEIAALVKAAKAMYDEESVDDAKAKLLQSGDLEDFLKSYDLSSLDSLDEKMWESDELISSKRTAFIREHPDIFTGDFRHLYEKEK